MAEFILCWFTIRKSEKSSYFMMRSFYRCICGSLAHKLNRLSKNSTINLLCPLENRLAELHMLAAGERAVQHGNRIVFSGELNGNSGIVRNEVIDRLLRTLNIFGDKESYKEKETMVCFEVVNVDVLRGVAADVYK